MHPHPTVIVIPNFNDWESLRLLTPRLDRALSEAGRRATLLVVDDASTEPMPEEWADDFRAIDAIHVLHLRCNLGHQRAIALGLYHAHEFLEARAVIVMDGDGEDRAEDIDALWNEFEAAEERDVVFAARTKRMESLTFRLSYRAYRWLHRAATGVEVRVGNFSIAPRSALTRLMAVPDLWNHYAAAVYRARIPRRTLPLARGTRLAGHSKMNFVSLLVHGLTAMSVFSDRVSARLLAASAVFGVLALGAIGMTTVAAPAWAGIVAGTLLGLVAQSVIFATLFAFLIASRRSSTSFILQRDAAYFLMGATTVWQRSEVARLGEAVRTK